MSNHTTRPRRRPPSARSTLGEAGGAPQKTLAPQDGISPMFEPLAARTAAAILLQAHDHA
jgi:hypothetical protein